MKKKEKNIKRFTRSNLPATKTNIATLKKTSDKEIELAVASDSDASPILDEEWFKKARPVIRKKPKTVVSVRLSEKTLKWYKQHGHSSFMAQVLEQYAATHMD